jgi:glycosyltransferase involved in cell wall biosynthesis
MTPLRPDQLPLVSVVIINLNYGRYISQAIRSVLVQDYPNIECIIVDNGSTDDSVDVIQTSIAGHQKFQLIEFDTNYGQLGAFFRVLDQCGGELVTILDADDILAASFVSTHVQVHLALPKPMAFTSSNITEIDAAGRIRTGRYQGFGSAFFWDAPGLVDRDHAVRVPSVPDAEYDRLSPRVSSIPFGRLGWFWSPGSANMYRRTVLTAVNQVRTPAKYVRAVDAYLNPFCHALGGTALVDVPLSLYRVHDANYFAMRETLAGMKAGRPEFDALHTALAEETVEFILGNCLRFYQLLGVDRFWAVLDQLTRFMCGGNVYRSDAVFDSVVRHLPALRATIGDTQLAKALMNRLKLGRLVKLIGKLAGSRSNVGFVAKLSARVIAEPVTGQRRRTRQRARTQNRYYAVPEAGYPAKPHDYGPVGLISQDPPIFMTGIAFDELIGIAGAFGRRFGDIPAGFLIYPTWSIEEAGRVAAIGQAAREHRRRYPSHRLIVMANTQREADLLAAEGLPSVFLNKNFTVPEKIFRPLPDSEPEFDAIYNARFVPEKRHELAALIGKLAYLSYIPEVDGEGREQVALMNSLLRDNPSHTLLNPVVDGRPLRLDPRETNRQINRARIGLCLSEIEGSNYASMEYMLAGLGVVTTPSLGGRDVHFDPTFCIVCDPSPEAVRDAVRELKARNVPREHIRRATLARIEADRRRFLDLVDDLRAHLGGQRRITTEWPYGQVSGITRLDTFDSHLEEFERASKIEELGAQSAAVGEMVALGTAGIQLKPAELLPIVRSISAVPGCRLLVFGCGNDSPFWETTNMGGTTAFLEDDPAWLSAARTKLTRSIVEQVQYRTRAADWPAQLDAGDDLLLDLPDSIRNTQWDVILVDGPAGHRDDLPGRAQSIVTARRLIAPGGKIFVHDCDRPLEREFCARYLGEHRRFVSVSARAILNGYAF